MIEIGKLHQKIENEHLEQKVSKLEDDLRTAREDFHKKNQSTVAKVQSINTKVEDNLKSNVTMIESQLKIAKNSISERNGRTQGKDV